MAAGTQYNKHLNYDQAYVKTPAIYDSNLDEWLMLAGNYVKTAGGLWVPQKGSDDGEALVQLTGSFEQFDDLISSDTVVTAGSSIDFGPFIAKGKKIHLGACLEESRLWRIYVKFFSETYPSSYAPMNIIVVDNNSSAATNGSGIVDVYTKRYLVRLFNDDTEDMTVKVMIRGESY